MPILCQPETVCRSVQTTLRASRKTRQAVEREGIQRGRKSLLAAPGAGLEDAGAASMSIAGQAPLTCAAAIPHRQSERRGSPNASTPSTVVVVLDRERFKAALIYLLRTEQLCPAHHFSPISRNGGSSAGRESRGRPPQLGLVKASCDGRIKGHSNDPTTTASWEQRYESCGNVSDEVRRCFADAARFAHPPIDAPNMIG